jgi:hypothetical protein
MDNSTKDLADVVYEALFAKACKKVERDYQEHYGKTLLVSHVFGFRCDRSEHVERHLRPPLRMHVIETPTGMLHDSGLQNAGDWIDPQWYVEPLEENEQLDNIINLRVHGICRNIVTGREETYDWTLWEEDLFCDSDADSFDRLGMGTVQGAGLTGDLGTDLSMAIHELAKIIANKEESKSRQHDDPGLAVDTEKDVKFPAARKSERCSKDIDFDTATPPVVVQKRHVVIRRRARKAGQK